MAKKRKGEEMAGIQSDGDSRGGGGDGSAKSGAVDHNTTRSNRDGGLKDDGGGNSGGSGNLEKSGSVDHNTTRSNRDGGLKDDGGGNSGGSGNLEKSGSVDHNTTRSNREDGLKDDGGGNSGGSGNLEKSGSVDHNTTRSNRDGGLKDDGGENDHRFFKSRSGKSGGGGSGSGMVGRTIGKTLGMAKTVIMAAVLISVAGAGVDVYQTIGDATEINLEEHITDADFEMSDDKSEISGTVGFDIPQMGMFEKSIIASVHVTVLESNPTTDGDYEFEYTLGSGEQFYDFTLDDLDPVTVEKIEAGQPLDIEYSGTISVTYLGIKIPSVTMDIPLTTTTVETA
jgi:hypothetical protein